MISVPSSIDFRKIQLPKSSLKLPDFKKKKNQDLTEIIFTIIAICIFSFFAINPTLSTIAQLKKQIEDNTLVLEQMNQKVKALQNLRVQYASLKNDFPLMEAAIPQKSQVPLFLDQIEILTESAQAQRTRLSASPVELVNLSTYYLPEDPTVLSSYDFNLDVYEASDSAKTLPEIINFERIITLDQINKEIDSENERLNYSFKGKSYFKK